jgi:hypothetical protein
MVARACLALLAILAPATQQPRPPSATVAVRYSVVSEDDASNHGQVTLALRAGLIRSAVVWKAACRLAARADSLIPSAEADQYWSLTAELVTGTAARPHVRVMYRHVRPSAGAAPRDVDRVLSLDGRDPLVISDFAASASCQYDRITIALSAQGQTLDVHGHRPSQR